MTRPDVVDLIESLQSRIHHKLSPHFNGSPFAMLDFPDIRNVGDSAIWLGEIAYLDRYQSGVRPSYVSRKGDFSADDLRRAIGNGVIFIQGGGTFGDIWEAHQNFREMILEHFPDNPIVQLPQSIHFQSAERLEQAARIVSRHKNFTLLVRDRNSKRIADEQLGVEAKLCPDMAFGIGPIPREGQVRQRILAMLRNDAEGSGLDHSAAKGVPVEDWIEETRANVNVSKLLGLVSSLRPGRTPCPAKFHMLNAAARCRLERGRKQLSKAGVIVTDRLHVHIVSLLLGIPHAVLDNSYGKVSGFMDAFSGGTSLTYRTSSLRDALEWANEQSGVQSA